LNRPCGLGARGYVIKTIHQALRRTADQRRELGAVVEVRSYSDANGGKRLSLAARSDLTIDDQVVASGSTWLDRQFIAREPLPIEQGLAVSQVPVDAPLGHP
jgi:hypothetical protein